MSQGLCLTPRTGPELPGPRGSKHRRPADAQSQASLDGQDANGQDANGKLMESRGSRGRAEFKSP